MTDNTLIAPSQLRFALDDLVKGWQMSSLWLTLAWDDLHMRYQRSVLGPIWITLGTGFFVAVVGYLWSEIMGRPASVFVPWLATGLTLWQFISAVVTEGTGTFIRGSTIIHNIPMPLLIHVYRMVMRHVFNYLHNFIVVIFVLFVFPPSFSSVQLLLIPGLLIIVTIAVFTSLLLGIVGARFWDFSHTISVLMAPMFFMTPVLWMPDMLGEQRAMIAQFNPFTHFIAIVREPLLGRVPELMSYAVTVSFLLLLAPFSVYMLSLYRKRIAYWV